MSRILLFLCLLSLCFLAKAEALESTKPPKTLNTATLALGITKKLIKNSHLRLTGVCFWMTPHLPPKINTAPALSQFLPDLVVTVSNNPGENPMFEIKQLLENKVALKKYQEVYKTVTGTPLGFGNDSMLLTPAHLNEGRMRIVTVFGAPTGLLKFPEVTHSPETSATTIYYSSLTDAVFDRTELAELSYEATHPLLFIGHKIGTKLNHWGFEFPRSMHITQPSNFRASVVAAMHAADIVTNKKSLHAAIHTTNSCGSHCVVSNVIYDPEQKNIIWQEVYPENRNILPGDPEDFGVEDNKNGNGNYIFVIWRKYRGCVKQEGRLIAGVNVGSPQKR